MEPISTIVSALSEGAGVLEKGGSDEAVKDAYAALKALIKARVSDANVEQLEQKPDSKARRAVVEDQLEAAAAGDDPSLIESAKRLLTLIKSDKPVAVVSRKGGSWQYKEGNAQSSPRSSPTRGSIRLDVSTSTSILSSGSDFSIFVNISNPFDIPITIYQVLTHIPVELVDRNTARLVQVQRDKGRDGHSSELWKLYERLKDRLLPPEITSGVAVAVGTEFSPELSPGLNIGSLQVGGDANLSFGNVHLQLQSEPSPEELDAIFGRIDAARRGVIPVTLQPGDTVVRQFVLRTKNWLFFSPLNYTFNIQVTYSADGVDHTATIAHQVNLRSGMAAIAVGAIIGSVMGSTVRNLMTIQHGGAGGSMIYGTLVSVIASIAVVVAFARKASAQSFVSIEDFWGGGLIGFSVGFFGFDRFTHLFEPPGPQLQGQPGSGMASPANR